MTVRVPFTERLEITMSKLFKCKMCGGDLHYERGTSVVKCPYCETLQTLPRLDDDKRVSLYDRANHFRRQNEYDKAASIYEQILAEDQTDAEAYWSLVLCRYGIDYVVDPATHKRVPTINRMQYVSVLADEDYKSALKFADTVQRPVYMAEAHTIAEIQKDILNISRHEQPFDVFICYKEKNDDGERTKDSVLAQEIYYKLVDEKYKVFFSRITLEDKLGQQYEPYIFAALSSAKVMLVIGTKPEHFVSVWVKNEWSRFLALTKKDHDRVIIPCYRDMDPYDLPDELSLFQSLDMSKIGFLQDLERGIKKILQKEILDEKKQAKTDNSNNANNQMIDLINRKRNEELMECDSEIKIVEETIASLTAEFSRKSKRIRKKTQVDFNEKIALLHMKLKTLKVKRDSILSKYLLITEYPEERKKWFEEILNKDKQYREAEHPKYKKEYLQTKDDDRSYDMTEISEEYDPEYETTQDDENQSYASNQKTMPIANMILSLAGTTTATMMMVIGLVLGIINGRHTLKTQGMVLILLGGLILIIASIQSIKEARGMLGPIGSAIGSLIVIGMSRLVLLIDKNIFARETPSRTAVLISAVALAISIIMLIIKIKRLLIEKAEEYKRKKASR